MRRLLTIGVLLCLAVLLTVPGSGAGTGADPTPTPSTVVTVPLTSPRASSNRSSSTELSDRCRVTGDESVRDLVRQLAELCVTAARTVDRAWGDTWAEGPGRRTRLVVAADTEELAELLGRDSSTGLDDTAAVTVGPKHARAKAVYINGPAFTGLTDLGREVVLTHELVHVATRATGDNDAPTWLEEGYADDIAYRDTGLDADQIAGDALTASLPSRLPSTADFDASGTAAAIAYGRAWAAVTLLADRLDSDAALKEFYVEAASAGLEKALATAGFASEPAFVRAWRQKITELRR